MGMNGINKEKKFNMAIGVLLALLLLALVFIGYFYYEDHHVEDSLLYQEMHLYMTGEKDTLHFPEGTFAEGTGERIFLLGMDAFTAEEYEEAKSLFQQALEAGGSDPALEAYLHYYINQCIYKEYNFGNYDAVNRALDAAAAYPPLANDEDFLWKLINTISLSKEFDKKAVSLMQNYLKFADHLTLETWAWMKNYIAMLEYNNKEYAKSIRIFYDVESRLEQAERTPKLEKELRYAKEYIANIYFTFEDFRAAARQYQELIYEENDEDAVFESYSCGINMASAYLEIPDTHNARRAIQIVIDNLPYIDPSVVQEVEASVNDVLANIYIKEKNFQEANKYLENAEAYYQDNMNNEAFLGGQYHVMFTRCKYLVGKGEFTQAQKQLENMLTSGDAVYYGMQKELYVLLEKIYQKTGQNTKLLDVAQKLRKLDEDSSKTMRREYLEFSKYYRENNLLKERNTTLSQTNMFVSISVIVISAVLLVILMLYRSLSAKNITDQLTGVYNRKKLNQLLHHYKRFGTPGNFGVVMMDIDYFKRYNDTYGHPAGDEVLKEVAKVLKTSVRNKDVVIRYGGEEFLILLHEVQKKEVAEKVCRRIHEQLEKRAIPHEASEVSEHVTISIGLCYKERPNDVLLEKLIEYADECLYQSKENGRNRVTAKDLK